jgi:hypothetical protein
MPVLMTKQEASTWPAPNMHLAARGYFDPFGGLDLVANLMESIAAVKELLFALGALLYLCWSKWRDVAASEKAREISNYKEELDRLLNRTVEIEKAQLDVKDPVELEKYLDQVARIKLEAIDELTHEELRGDRMFHIFLTQCANLIREIQGKIHLYSRERSELQEEPPKGEDESIPV